MRLQYLTDEGIQYRKAILKQICRVTSSEIRPTSLTC